MAYFSNSSEGDALEVMCGNCAHYESCNVYFLQSEWNYGQFEDSDASKAKKLALDLLIPQKDGKTKCTMFIPLESLTEAAKDEATKNHRADRDHDKLQEWNKIYAKNS